MEIGSAGVDGKSLFYNPQFIDALTIPQCAGLLAHEILHTALGHHVRRYNRDPKKWNYACDFAIDPIVEAAGLELPDVVVGGKEYKPHIDEQFKDMSADHIYSLLPDPPPNFSGGGMGEVFDSPSLSDGTNDSPDQDQNTRPLSKAEYDAISHKESIEWKIATQQAAQVAKMAGKLPAMIEQLVEEINKPKINWIAVLRTFMTEIRKDDYLWSRPNRRHLSNDIFLPMMRSEGMGQIVIAVDTSGSITDPELQQFAGELNSILGDVKPEKVHVLYCDTQIAHIEEFLPEDFPVTLHKHGGGGTDFTEPFLWTEQNCSNPACLVYLTDLYGPCNAPKPPYPVLWVCTSKQEDIPFGQLLPLEIELD